MGGGVVGRQVDGWEEGKKRGVSESVQTQLMH